MKKLKQLGYLDGLIEDCHKLNREVKRAILVDELVSWGLVLCVVGLLIVIFLTEVQ